MIDNTIEVIDSSRPVNFLKAYLEARGWRLENGTWWQRGYNSGYQSINQALEMAMMHDSSLYDYGNSHTWPIPR